MADPGWRATTTWDGLPVSDQRPRGATVVVWRTGAGGEPEFLVLHRSHHGPAFEGDWAWTPPAGARLPGEAIEECAARELLEEAGLALACRALAAGADVEWALFVAQAGADDAVDLGGDVEHDGHEWLTLEAAVARCLPAVVGAQIRAAAGLAAGEG